MKDIEISVSFKDVMREILIKWKWLIVSAIVCAILGNCFGIFKDYRAAAKKVIIDVEKGDESVLQSIETAKKPLSDDEIADVYSSVELYNDYRELFRSAEEYLTNSIYVKVDYQHAPTESLLYYIDVNTNDSIEGEGYEKNGESIALAFRDTVLSEIDYDFLCNQFGTKEEYIRELIVITAESDTLSIIITGIDEEQCELMQKICKKAVDAAEKQISSGFPSYTINLVSDDFYYAYNDDIYQRKVGVHDNMYAARANYLSIENTIPANQKKLFSLVLEYSKLSSTNEIENSGLEKEDVESNSQEMVSGSMVTRRVSYVHKKLIIAGFFGGILLAALIIAIRYVLKPVIRVEENLSEDMGQTIIGLVPANAEGSAYDSCIKEISTNARIAIKKNGFENIYITGVTDKNEQTIADIKEALKEFCNTESGACIVKDMDSLSKFSECDAAIFVEKAGDSNTDDVIKEINLAEQSKVSVLGFVFMK